MTTKGTADKEAIIDCIVWGDFPLDSNFKQLLLLPIVRAPDDEVWDTLIRQLPLYLRKRLDGQLRAARLDLELSGPDSRFIFFVFSLYSCVSRYQEMVQLFGAGSFVCSTCFLRTARSDAFTRHSFF